MAIERRFADIRTTQPISFSVYRDRFCFIGPPMETDYSKEGGVAPQEVHAYLMCDEAELPPDQRDGPRIRRAKILALWDGRGTSCTTARRSEPALPRNRERSRTRR